MSNPNNNEKAPEANNKNYKKEDLKGKFIKEFTTSFLIGSEKNQFLDEIMNQNKIVSGSFLELKIQEFKANNDIFKDFNESEINIFDFKRSIGREYYRKENTKANYLQKTFSDYDLSDKQRKKLEEKIEDESEKKLEKYINSNIEQEKFIKSIFGSNYIKKNSFDILSNILDYEKIKFRISSKSNEEQNEILSILASIQDSYKVTDSDIKTLFSSGVFSHAEKKEFISIFIPYITLKDAVDLGLFTQGEADAHKKTLIKELLDSDGVDDVLKDDIIDRTILSDIKIDTKRFLASESSLDDLAQNIGFKNLEEDSKKLIEEAELSISKNGIKNLKELKTIFSSEEYLGKIDNIEKFNEGSVLKIISKGTDGSNIINYIEIVKTNDELREISYRDLGDNYGGDEKINLKLSTEPKKVSYNNFRKKISESSNQKNIFYTKDDIKKQINDPENTLKSSDLDLLDISDLNSENRASFESEYKEDLNLQLNELIKELDSNNSEIKSVEERIKVEKNADFSTENDSGKRKKLEQDSKNEIKLLEEKIKALKIRNDKIQLFIDEKNVEISELDNANVSSNKLIPLINKNNLIKKLDEIDPEGKAIGFEKGQYLKATDGKAKGGLYQIGGINLEKQEVTLISIGEGGVEQKEELSFEAFYTAFKENKAKRQENFNSFDKLTAYNQKSGSSWNDISFKSGKIIQKGAGKEKKDLEVEYFVSKNEIIKVKKISGNQITVCYGEKKESKDIEKAIKKDPKLASKYKNHIYKDKDGSIKYSGISLGIDKTEHVYTLNEFNDIITDYKNDDLSFKPDSTLGKGENDLETNEEISEFDKESTAGFMKGLFNNLSLSEVLMGGKMMVEGIEEYFKKGNDIHAARVALGLGKILPEEVKADLLIKVERAEGESMDKEIESLGKVDSGIATNRIKGWLLDKNTPEYKKEAGLMFVLSKYGTLTGKKALYDFKGKFVWYEAFGGKIGDELYMQVKADAESSNPPQAFSEEKLMYVLINKQSKGILKPKRRSRLYKDYDGKWKNGIKEEVEKGYSDASNMRTSEDMVKGGNDELLGGTLPNAIGWYKKAIERGGSLEKMSEGFFLMLFSGALYTTDQAVYTPFIKSMWDADGMPQIMARMSSNIPDMKNFNRTVVALSEKIEAKDPKKYGGMASKARGIYNRALNNEGTEKERINDSKAFWDSYGEVLSRSLNMVTGGEDEEKNKEFINTDKILIEESFKNPKITGDSNERESLTNLQEFYKKIQSYSTEGTFKKDFIEDDMGAAGIGGMNILEVVKMYFQLTQQGGAREEKAFKAIWKGIISDINRTKDKKVLVHILSQLIGGILTNTGFNTTLLGIYNKPTTDLGKNFNKWGINIERDFGQFSAEDIINMDKNVEPILNKIAENIISGNSSGYNGPGFFDDFTNDVKNKTQTAVNNSDYNNQQAV